MSKPVVTRFAPSPTGFLHIGGARTALFNWLYARANNGKMLLRIEDTDQQRFDKEATNAIYEGLKWLGINWDDESTSQSSRINRHREIVQQLLEEDKVYRCYASAEELNKMRKTARETSTPMVYQWRERNPALAPSGVKPAIRLKTPDNGKTIVRDQIQGNVVFQNRDLDDMVLLRSDNSPTYMHAVVVDDHDMGITHIIRGDDHLTNAARQILLYQALEWDIPAMAHIPLIHGPDGAKLSKRHGAPGVEAYRAMGYLPQALRNYLVRLGWSHGNDEIISMEQMIEWFDVKAIGKGSSRFDFAKLEHLNSYYIRNSDTAILLKELLATAQFLENGRCFSEPLNERYSKRLIPVMSLVKKKAKNLNELAISSQFIFSERPIKPDEKAKEILNSENRARLAQLLPCLEKTDTWNLENLNASVQNFCQESKINLGKVAQPIRCAMTGTSFGPGIFEIMELFGREETLSRIHDQLSKDDCI